MIFESEKKLLEKEAALNKQNIFPRRYFYPSVNVYEDILKIEKMPVSEDISRRILCLPLYYNLRFEEMDIIIELLQ